MKRDDRHSALVEYLNLLSEGAVDKEVYYRYQDVLESVTPFEVNSALEDLLLRYEDIEAAEIPVARFIRSVGRALEAQTLPTYAEGSLLASLAEENAQIEQRLAELQTLSKELHQDPTLPLSHLIEPTAAFTLLADHYVRLQNELFPLFERASEEHSCVKLMWALQDEVLRARSAVLATGDEERSPFYRVFGRYFVLAGLLNFRERYILYPVAHQALETMEEVSIPFGTGFVSKTGSLTNNELERIFSTLPFDIAFIDRDDRVQYYSDPPHRIFPRSPQVIGRLVQNCHPPKSVNTVEEILSSFKEGREDHAEFYLVLGGKFIHIQYFAVRDVDNTYMGTMEVSLDATHLRSLRGEKRLL